MSIIKKVKGSAFGFFLEAAKKDGWEPLGVELSKFALSYAQEKGLKVFLGDFPNLELEDKFEVITFGDSIEYLRNPRAALIKANLLLEESRLLVISPGNIESIDAKISKNRIY